MLDYKVKIGLLTIRRNATDRPRKTFLNWFSAEERGRKFTEYIEKNFATENVSFADCKGLGIQDLVYDSASAKDVVSRFKDEGVDAMVIINCNFGNEEAAADIAKELDVPVLLYAPLDDEYYLDGMRPTDSQCGLFGMSRQMQRMHIPFSFIRSCEIDSEEFKNGFEKFTRVACMVKNFRGMRVGQVGCRTAPFFSVIYNEGELLEKFGIKVIPINLALIEARMKSAPELYAEEIKEYKSYFECGFKVDEQTMEKLDAMATLTSVYKHLYEEFDLDVISSECWTAMPVMFDGLAPCAVFGLLNDMGYLVACESDLHAAITMALLKCATFGNGKPLFGEFTVRHPENVNRELLWHCGPFPLSECAEGTGARLVNQRIWMRARDGEYTLARFDQESGDYKILPLICRTADGPQTHGAYIWGEFDDLGKVEEKLMNGPYIHHFVEIRGNYLEELREFCKFVSELSCDGI